MAIEEIGMCRVNVAGLHGDKVGHKLRRRLHGCLEEVHDDTVESLAQRWIPPEGLLLRDESSV